MRELSFEIFVWTTSGRARAFGETPLLSCSAPASFSVDSWLLLDETDLSIRDELVSFEDAGEGVYDQNLLVYTDGLLEARLYGLVGADA